MRRECIFIVWYLTLVFLLSASFDVSAKESGLEYSKGCAHLRCKSGSQCIKRRFWCKNPPCPGMLYCSKSRKESLKGPFICDTVRCNSGHICVVRVQGCRWDEKCQQQIARCISEKEYHEGAISCAGFECPPGKHCILRESHCVSPPCKLLRSCAETKDVQNWFDKCRTMDCLSKYECFLRRPDDDCVDTSCAYTPDCTLTAEDELINKHCRGWICPRMQKCVVQIIGTCKGFGCTIERSCRSFNVSSSSSINHDIFASNKTEEWSTERTTMQIDTELARQEIEKHEMNTLARYPITKKKTTTMASTKKQTDYITLHGEHGTEISMIHQQTTKWLEPKSSSIAEPPDTSPTRPDSMSYFQSWLNSDKLLITSTMGNKLKITDKGNTHMITSSFSDSRNSSFPAISFTERGFESTTVRDTTSLELLKKIYIATDDAVLSFPVVLDGINLVGQGYPIWIEHELHRTAPLRVEDENESRWKYYAPREPYRILLPPYEPVIVEDTRRGQLPLFTYALGHLFNEAALLSLQEIPSRGTTEISEMDNNPKSMFEGINNDTNVFATVGMGNLKTNHSDDSSDDYANLRAMKKTDIVAPNIRDRQSDDYYNDYEWRPSHVIHDYLEKSKPQSIDEKERTSSEFATNDSRRNKTHTSTDVKTLVRSQITHENRGRISDTQFAYKHNKNLATLDPVRVHFSTRRSDYSSEDDEERYDLVNYFYNTIAIYNVDKSNEQQESSLNNILDISQNQESTTFLFGELDQRRNGRPTMAFLHETSPYRTYNDNNERNDDREYDEYYSHEDHDNISSIETTGS